MAEFLFAAASFVLATVALGLVRILRGPAVADRIMAAQLLGTGGIGALLLVAAATGLAAAIDVALSLALLAAFASVAFVNGIAEPAEPRLLTANEPRAGHLLGSRDRVGRLVLSGRHPRAAALP
jgi:multicomponent Na+:H+ antiporter subunit F